ncbi:extracellular sulfatase Sulf-1 [Centruroides vittatus]|uniref:extracellular sulfatase Sulf-1 n=1 Tax=Centruroides vittatus TaxID=120091 RepID=UPI00351066A3
MNFLLILEVFSLMILIEIANGRERHGLHQDSLFYKSEAFLDRQDYNLQNQRQNSKYSSWGNNDKKELRSRKQLSNRDKKPNIILIITDDQDIELGSMNFMPKTLRILGEGGAHFPNAYVTTPMCCPSRSSLLTGLYVHNHNVYTNNDNCSSPMWQQEHEPRTFATYLNNAGYRTAFFGKYLNDYNGSYIPPGWREWAGLIRNSRFYNYTVNINGNKIKHGNNYYQDYYPDLIANDSISFLRQSKQYFINKPVLMVLSFPSPHGPEDTAPPYQHLFQNITTHRTPSWNYAPNPDKQWLLRNTGKMEPLHIKFTDMLHTKRLQTLQSVDDAVDKLYKELKLIGELENTYIFYTSDHGYHLGQFGLVKGKSMPFEFDIRVPFYIRGPRVPTGVRIRDIVLNLDIAPTFLDIAGVQVPEHMDGKSILPLLKDAYNWVVSGHSHGEVKHKKSWRDTFLIERGVITPAMRKALKGQLSSPTQTKLTKDERLSVECQNEDFASPCKPFQKWECFHDGYRWRIRKCRLGYYSSLNGHSCTCSDTSDSEEILDSDKMTEVQKRSQLKAFSFKRQNKMDASEKRLQRRFLKEHVSKEFKPVFIGSRPRRDLSDHNEMQFDVDGIIQLSHLLDLTVNEYEDEMKFGYKNVLSVNSSNGTTRKKRDKILGNVMDYIYTQLLKSESQQAAISEGCIQFPNNSITCVDYVYKNPQVWRQKKEKLDQLIKELRQKLDELKGIRRHLKKSRPFPYDDLNGEKKLQNKHCKCLPDFKHQLDLEWKEEKDTIKSRQKKKEENVRKLERKQRRKLKFHNMTCNAEKMNCFTHDNNHWKTPPLWTYGPFCFCQNSNNNTYWCLRTINETHNFLYCEFITRFIVYYDLKADPYQLTNVIYKQDVAKIQQLHLQLHKLRKCKGARECTVRYRPDHHNRWRPSPVTTRNFRHWRRHQKWRPGLKKKQQIS